MSRKRILADIEEERQLQAVKHDVAADDEKLEHDWLALLVKHLGLSVRDGNFRPVPAEWRRQLIRVGAIVLAAVESHDRVNGVEHGAGRPVEDRGPEY